MKDNSPIRAHLEDHAFMNDLFPFYFLLDHKLSIINFGRAAGRTYSLQKNQKFSKYFAVDRPLGVKTYEDFLKYENSPFIINCVNLDKQKLRGQIFSRGSKLLCFLGTPLLNSIENLKPLNLTFRDFPTHDSIGQFLLSFQAQSMSIKEARQMAEKVKLNNAKLKEINQSLDSFMYKLTHDLRGPATNIQSMLKMLTSNTNDNSPSKNQEIIGHATSATRRLIKTIDGFLALSAAEKSGDRKPESCSLHYIINEVEENLNSSILENSVTITKEIPPDTYVYAVMDDLISVIQNLMSNSIKYRSKEVVPKIRITSTYIANTTVITFSDNGMGIDLNIHGDKVFKMFSRLHTLPEVQGTGVGLYLVKKLLEKNNSTIGIESEVGKGTTFKISIPKTK